MIKTPPIFVILTIGKEQKTVQLAQKKESWSIYDILMDNQIHGQIQKAGKDWAVVTHRESPIQREYYQALIDAINRAIENVANPNS